MGAGEEVVWRTAREAAVLGQVPVDHLPQWGAEGLDTAGALARGNEGIRTIVRELQFVIKVFLNMGIIPCSGRKIKRRINRSN